MTDNSQKDFDEELQARLLDPTKRFELWQRMNSAANPSTPCGMFPGAVAPHLTPSGMVQGAGSSMDVPSGTIPAGFHGMPMWWPPFPPFFTPYPPAFPAVQPPAGLNSTPSDTSEQSQVGSNPPVHSESTRPVGNTAHEKEESSDELVLHEPDQDSLFDPSIESTGTWDPPDLMNTFLEKYFNRSWDAEEREAIAQDYPKPNCPALEVPKLDDDVKQQLKQKGKDPYFGAERTMFDLQEQILEIAGPLTYLWSHLLNPEEELDADQMKLVIQRALVILGSALHSISLERRKIAWARINPELKPLALEDYKDRKDKLFGPGFLEKASKKLETDKALAKVAAPPLNPKKRARPDEQPDLRSFLSKGAPSKYGGRGFQRQTKPYNKQYPNSRQQKNYQPPKQFKSNHPAKKARRY